MGSFAVPGEGGDGDGAQGQQGGDGGEGVAEAGLEDGRASTSPRRPAGTADSSGTSRSVLMAAVKSPALDWK